MDVLTFVARVVEALAWPITVLLVARIFRSQILALVPNLTELTLPGGIAAKFNKQLEVLEAVVKTEPLLSQASERQLNLVDEPVRFSVGPDRGTGAAIDALALVHNPNGVVMESWKEIEAAMMDVLIGARATTLLTLPSSPSEQIALLREKSLASPNVLSALEGLWTLRNQVAHTAGFVVTPEAASSFADIAKHAIAGMRALAEQKRAGTPGANAA